MSTHYEHGPGCLLGLDGGPCNECVRAYGVTADARDKHGMTDDDHLRCARQARKFNNVSTVITKRALIREPGAPIGQSAPMYLNCGCGSKVYVPLMFTDQQTVSCEQCGQHYNRKGYVVL